MDGVCSPGMKNINGLCYDDCSINNMTECGNFACSSSADTCKDGFASLKRTTMTTIIHPFRDNEDSFLKNIASKQSDLQNVLNMIGEKTLHEGADLVYKYMSDKKTYNKGFTWAKKLLSNKVANPNDVETLCGAVYSKLTYKKDQKLNDAQKLINDLKFFETSQTIFACRGNNLNTDSVKSCITEWSKATTEDQTTSLLALFGTLKRARCKSTAPKKLSEEEALEQELQMLLSETESLNEDEE